MRAKESKRNRPFQLSDFSPASAAIFDREKKKNRDEDTIELRALRAENERLKSAAQQQEQVSFPFPNHGPPPQNMMHYTHQPPHQMYHPYQQQPYQQQPPGYPMYPQYQYQQHPIMMPPPLPQAPAPPAHLPIRPGYTYHTPTTAPHQHPTVQYVREEKRKSLCMIM
mmetsp:Transcript_27671/g.40973  ORF Transcript_27671/g.40973 Transcript_27671/m.40973 type:complete len:167 (-) Transcript_27671:63-563(-)